METTAVERLIHLVMFLTAGLTVGLGAIALVERIGGGERLLVSPRHVGGAAVLFLILFVAERIYHL